MNPPPGRAERGCALACHRGDGADNQREGRAAEGHTGDVIRACGVCLWLREITDDKRNDRGRISSLFAWRSVCARGIRIQ